MSRTLALYGLAASTLVGAFLLVPRSAPPPVEVNTPPVGPRVPLVRLSSSDGVVAIDARLDRGFIARADALPSESGEALHMDIALRAIDSDVRAPLVAALVIDRSGSMAGDGIENARFAADRFIRRLADGDRLAVISYATDVSVDFALQTIDATTRTEALRVVGRIEEGGGTNIEGGLQAAMRLLGDAAKGGGTVGRVVFVSDGRPTEGSRDERALSQYAARLRAAGVAVSSLGVGLDYNEDLMTALAREGGGRYHYLREARHLSKILDDELSHATRVVARGVSVTLPTEIAGFRVEAAPGQLISSGQDTQIFVGDLAAGEERHVLVRLSVPSIVDDRAFELTGPAVTYRSTDGSARRAQPLHDRFRVFSTSDTGEIESSRRSDVVARVLQVRAAEVIETSMQLYSSGDVDGARKNMAETRAWMESANKAIGDALVADEVANLERAIAQTAAAPAASSEGAALQKEQKMRAYQLRR